MILLVPMLLGYWKSALIVVEKREDREILA